MSVIIISAVICTTAATIYWYINRHKPMKHILSELKYTIDLQGVGVAALVDDWVNTRRNQVVLPDAKRKVAVITGGAKGIGTEVIRGLLKANMRVVMGIRNPEQAKKLSESMENGENLVAMKLDLKSMKSVKEFARKVNEEYPEIYRLVNCAGIMFGDYEVTEDGFESQLAVNYLGHFYLTHLLLPGLKRSGVVEGPARIVNVTSIAHYIGKVYFEDINMKDHYDTIAAYVQSKLAQIMSARYLNKMLEDAGTPVKAFSVHPGIVNTDLFDKTAFKPWYMKLWFKTPEKGATPILHACFEESLDKNGGLYISNCIEGKSSNFSKNVDYQKKLFEISCGLIGIDKNSFGQES